MSGILAAAAPVCLDVSNLDVSFDVETGRVCAVRDLSLHVREHECVGIAGESGSGKTQLFMAVMGLLPRSAHVSGQVIFDGADLLRASSSELNRVRGDRLCMVFQDPLSALTPHLTVGRQLIEGLMQHRDIDRASASALVEALLVRMRIDHPARRMRQYPHELSGGQRQRVLIAMACALNPKLLIADEPTTALDPSVQAEAIDLLASQRAQAANALVLISHDLALLEGAADRVYILYAGRVVESGPAYEVFAQPLHPYSAGLLACGRFDAVAEGASFPTIEGTPPRAGQSVEGCAFAPRCHFARERCTRETPRLLESSHGRAAACHYPLA